MRANKPNQSTTPGRPNQAGGRDVRGSPLAEELAGSVRELRDGAAVTVRHPDAPAIERHRLWSGADGERAQDGAVAGPQLGHGVAEEARDPDVAAVECHTVGSVAHGERAHGGAVACAPVGDVVAMAV